MSDPGETAPSNPGVVGDILAQGADEAFCSSCSQSFAPTVQFCPNDGARLVRFRGASDPLIGRVIDERFEVQAQIGRGGMGTVYRAWQRSVDREVAIKVIDAKLSNDRVAAKRFLREARLSSRLGHPAVVVVYDFGQTDDGVLYLVMELLRGHTLAAELASKAITPRRAIRIGVQLCDALEAAHRQSIVHRDLKPQNVVILDEPPGRDLVKVLDFGLAKSLVHHESTVTQSDAILGTPLYMAPESIQGRGADERSDLYSLGCILHELLSGKPPYRDASPNMVLAKHLSEPAPPLSPLVPAPLRALVAELLAKDPDARPAGAGLVRDRLQAMIESGGTGLDLRPYEVDSDAVTPSAGFAETMDVARALADQTREASTREAPTRVAFDPPAASTRPRWPWLAAALICVAGGGVALLLWLRADGPAPDRGDAVEPPAAAAAADAAFTAGAAIDAGAASVPPDAAAAAVAPPPDAGTKQTRKDGPRPTRPDAGVPVRPDAGAVSRPPPIDAGKPDVDFIMPPPKPGD